VALNCESGSRSRRTIEFNRRNILNISRIKFNGPTPGLFLGRNFETTSNILEGFGKYFNMFFSKEERIW
jgi:hypothetical protein